MRRGEVPVRTGGERRKHEEDGTHHRLRKVARSRWPAAAYGAERGPGEWRGPPKTAPPGGEAKGIKTPRCDWPGEGGPGARPLVNALMSEFTE